MKRLFLLPSIALCLAGCMDDGDTLTHHSARQAAERYYALLASGDCEGFAQGIEGTDSLMQLEMTDLVAQFLHEQCQARGGIISANAVADSLSKDSTADVYLELLYSDSTSEQICLPLRLHQDRWMMR